MDVNGVGSVGGWLYEFRYHATAPHSTQYMRFYLTRSGFDPALRPLEWSDLEQVAEVPRSQIVTTADSRYVVRLNLPVRSGRHVLYMIWQRADSQEAFYSCSDVTFGPAPVPTPSSFSHLGQLSIQQALPVNTVLNLRVFGVGGRDLETLSTTVTSATTVPANALAQLAAAVNSVSPYVRVGTLSKGSISIPDNVTVMQVYALPGAGQVTYQLDTVLPVSPSVPVPAGSWMEGSTYVVNQIVTYNGVSYRCLQAHTAWRGAGWFPSAAGMLDVVWKRI